VPELPDLVVYLERLAPRVLGQPITWVRFANPFVLRTVSPPIAAAEGKRVVGLRRMGKRLVLALDGGLFLVLHLMIAGRLRWAAAGAKVPGRVGLAAFDFPTGALIVTEAGTKRRASLHLKRALTDPRLFSGIGNAYSDEILHRARLSPIAHTNRLSAEEIARLYDAARATLAEWTGRLRAAAGEGFPGKVTAFREGMAVHGRFRPALPGLRRAGAADPLRRQRDQLLRALPDGREAPGRPLARAAPPPGLAEVDRRGGVA
jgi:formamidopyrimidine-DNA glycosylase